MTENPVIMGAYHAPAWAGIVVSDQPGQGAAFRFLVSRRGERADWTDMTHLISELGPAAADGLYARLGFDTTRPFVRDDSSDVPTAGHTTFVLEWSRVEEHRLIGRATCEYPGRCELRGYFPWNWSGTWAIDRSDLVAQWGPRPSGVMVRAVHRPALRRSDRGRAILDASGDAGVRFNVDLGSRIYFEAVVIDDEPDPVRMAPDIDAIETALAESRRTYEDRRTMVSGNWAGLGESLAATSQWSVLMQPETGERYLPAGREWVFPTPSGEPEPWMTFAWDSFLTSMELAVEAPDLAESAIRAVLETQYPNGNVPNWRGLVGGTPDRSQPPIGSYAVLKHYLRTGNRDLLEWSLPFLQRWNAWWYAPKGTARRRDGNANGLFNWGWDRDLAAEDAPPWEHGLPPLTYAGWESGQGDLPHWEEAAWMPESETMDLDTVDLNTYLALDFESLARIARELGDADREIWYLEQYRALRKRINDTLWDDETGVYRDRHWDGRRSPHLGAANFLPLLAGIPSPEQADRMVRVLTDPGRMWGRYVIPSVSRDNPLFSDDDFWRSAIRAPANYFVYQGLRRYHLDNVAAELAHRSVDMYLAAWRQHHATFERFDCTSGKGRGRRHLGAAALFALMGIEQFIDVTPWDGLRLGTPTPGATNTLHRLALFGQRWSVHMAGDGLVVAANGVDILRTTGPAVLRELVFESEGLSSLISTEARIDVTIETMHGACHAEIDGEVHALAHPIVTIPEGTHRFRIRAES